MERIINVHLSKLIRGCKNRDIISQREVYLRYYKLMIATCFRYCNCKEDAEDIVQEGFVKVFDKIDSFDEKGSFEGWLKRVFINMALDEIRKKKVYFISIDESENTDYHLGQADVSLEKEEHYVIVSIGRERLLKLIKNLSPMYRMVFNLYAIEGYTHLEISEMLKISVGTSKSNFFKAKKKLKKDIEILLKSKYAS